MCYTLILAEFFSTRINRAPVTLFLQQLVINNKNKSVYYLQPSVCAVFHNISAIIEFHWFAMGLASPLF